MISTTFSAPDIECEGCATAIKRALGALPGVSSIDVDIDRKRVVVAHENASAPTPVLIEALDAAGYTATALSQ